VPTLNGSPAVLLEETVDVSPTSETSVTREIQPSTPVKKSDRIAQAMLLAVILAAPALMCVHSACARDLDIWWHLRTGEWMLQHHAVPRVDSFSAPFAGKPWLSYSWLFELIMIKLYQGLGLLGPVVYSATMIFAITAAVYHLIRRMGADFTLSVLLTFAAMYGMGHLFTPRSWLFTMLFFALELDILMHARITGKLRELAWLPVIFALWANVHIVFVDGLAVLGLAFAEAVLAPRWPSAQKKVSAIWMGAALGSSVLATLLNPYGWHIYGVAHDLATQAGALNFISELQAISFRSLSDFVVLALALGAAATRGWQRKLVSFESGLLVFATVLSFRSQRDVWMVAMVAVAILSSSAAGRKKAVDNVPVLGTWLASIAAILAVMASFPLLHVNNRELQKQMEANLPVRAVEVVRERGYRGPVFNDFNWGGYLIWSLRWPVSIDGRQNVYGDERMNRSVSTWNAAPDWRSDTQLASAGVVIGPVRSPLTQLLRMDSRFQLAYEDDVAAVFVAHH
jgi:hypothetical protein